MSKGVSKSTYVQTANENVFISFTPMHLYLLLYNKMSKQLLFVCFGEMVRWCHIATTGPSSCCVAEASTAFQIILLLSPNWWVPGMKLSFLTALLRWSSQNQLCHSKYRIVENKVPTALFEHICVDNKHITFDLFSVPEWSSLCFRSS